MKIQVVMNGDDGQLDEFEGVFVGEDVGRLIFRTQFGLRTYAADTSAWAEVAKFSYEAEG